MQQPSSDDEENLPLTFFLRVPRRAPSVVQSPRSLPSSLSIAESTTTTTTTTTVVTDDLQGRDDCTKTLPVVLLFLQVADLAQEFSRFVSFYDLLALWRANKACHHVVGTQARLFHTPLQCLSAYVKRVISVYKNERKNWPAPMLHGKGHPHSIPGRAVAARYSLHKVKGKPLASWSYRDRLNIERALFECGGSVPLRPNWLNKMRNDPRVRISAILSNDLHSRLLFASNTFLHDGAAGVAKKASGLFEIVRRQPLWKLDDPRWLTLLDQRGNLLPAFGGSLVPPGSSKADQSKTLTLFLMQRKDPLVSFNGQVGHHPNNARPTVTLTVEKDAVSFALQVSVVRELYDRAAKLDPVPGLYCKSIARLLDYMVKRQANGDSTDQAVLKLALKIGIPLDKQPFVLPPPPLSRQGKKHRDHRHGDRHPAEKKHKGNGGLHTAPLSKEDARQENATAAYWVPMLKFCPVLVVPANNIEYPTTACLPRRVGECREFLKLAQKGGPSEISGVAVIGQYWTTVKKRSRTATRVPQQEHGSSTSHTSSSSQTTPATSAPVQQLAKSCNDGLDTSFSSSDDEQTNTPVPTNDRVTVAKQSPPVKRTLLYGYIETSTGAFWPTKYFYDPVQLSYQDNIDVRCDPLVASTCLQDFFTVLEARLWDSTKQIGLLTNCCFMCGQPLQDAESLKRGIGPVCAQYLGSVLETTTTTEQGKVGLDLGKNKTVANFFTLDEMLQRQEGGADVPSAATPSRSLLSDTASAYLQQIRQSKREVEEKRKKKKHGGKHKRDRDRKHKSNKHKEKN